jgi:hypothetical protein
MEQYGAMKSAYVAKEGSLCAEAVWLVAEHLGGAVLYVLKTIFKGNVDLFKVVRWANVLREWRMCIANCPWRTSMLAELDAFIKGTEYPSTDPDVEPLLLLAVLLRYCAAIKQLVLRLSAPPVHSGLILAHAGSEELLPVMRLLLGACPIGPDDTYVIKPLTKPHNLHYTLPVLRSVFDDKTLIQRCHSRTLAGLQAHGVHFGGDIDELRCEGEYLRSHNNHVARGYWC